MKVQVAAPVTRRSVLDALEAAYPVLRGTVRDQARRARSPSWSWERWPAGETPRGARTAPLEAQQLPFLAWPGGQKPRPFTWAWKWPGGSLAIAGGTVVRMTQGPA